MGERNRGWERGEKGGVNRRAEVLIECVSQREKVVDVDVYGSYSIHQSLLIPSLILSLSLSPTLTCFGGGIVGQMLGQHTIRQGVVFPIDTHIQDGLRGKRHAG